MPAKRFVLAACALICAIAIFLWFTRERAAATTAAVGGAAAVHTGSSIPTAHQSPSRGVQHQPANPYASALRVPGKSKREWDPTFIRQFTSATKGDPIRFELTESRVAVGTIKTTQFRDGKLTYLGGELTAPEPGRFFFLTPPAGGKAGKAVGVIEFPGSKTAFRIEPTGVDGEPELWERRLDEVLCMSMPLKEQGALGDAEEMPPLRPDLVPDFVPSWNSNIISLQSFPGSSAVLLLDFFGGYTPTWGGVSYDKPNVSNAQIKDLWKRVAEDYQPFNINVTTDLKVFNSAPASSRMRCVFTPAASPVGSSAAGVAYIGSWNWGSDTVCWSIYTSGKSGAEVGAHEAGHTLGLSHQGTSTSGYYTGHGSDPVGWAPIMGAGYYELVVSWAKGEYQNANNTEDELNIIVSNNNNVDYRADDTGAILSAARYLEIYNTFAASAEGVIERTGDTDAFQFTTTGGTVNLTANPVGNWANLAVMVTLANSNNVVIASNNPQSVLSATISSNVPAGTYTFRVTGAGRNNALNSGFSAYGSLGYYSITGTVAGARLPNRFAIAERSPNGTVAGVIPATNPNGDALAFTIVAGNSNSAFAVDSAGTLTVANSTALNYETLALSTVFPVQFELLVNISNTVTSAAELNRRVVVLVTNVNEAPSVSGFSTTVIEHTAPGTLVGQVVGTDPDFYTSLLYSIAAGNSNNMFAINSGSGVITVAGDPNAAAQSVYSLRVLASDQAAPTPLMATSTVTITIVSNTTALRPGSIAYAIYDGITNTTVAALTNAAAFPRDPTWEKQLTLFEGEIDRDDNFGAALRGYIIAPATGAYTFWIASDDNSQLLLSTNASPSNATVIASVANYTGSREWTKYSSQQSATINLIAGNAYYVEARMKEGGGGDNIAVAWQCTSAGITREVIPGRYLAPFFMNYLPHVSGYSYRLHKDAFLGSQLGAVTVTDVNTNDDHTFAIVGGNTDGVFAIDTNSGVIRIVNEAALAATSRTSYSLSVRAWDNGSPQLSNTTTVTFNLYTPGTVTTTNPRQELWMNIGGNAVSDLTNNTRFPLLQDMLRSLGSFDSGEDIGENYGSRLRAFLKPTNSGAFTFFIASDDSSQLRLSTDTNPANATLIASLSGATDYKNWTANSSQKSAAISLVAGQSYYIEALQKEGVGGDHLAVAWTGPGITTTNVIAGSFLTPVDLNYAPTLTNKTASVSINATNGATVTTVTAIDSPLDPIAYKLVSGNSGNAFAIDPMSGRIAVLNRNALASSGGIFNLTVRAQDSGLGGYYPLKTDDATVTVEITGTNWPPQIALLAPTNNAVVPNTITFSVSATDPGSSLSRVDFYANGAKLGQSTVAPYAFTWFNAPLGQHTLFAVAVDNTGLSGTSMVANVTVAPSVAATLVASNAVWKFLDNGSDPGTAWRSNNFNDNTWSSGPAQLGYGDGDEATVVGYGGVATNKFVTTFFRRAFYIHDPSLLMNPTMRLLRDDGIVVYLNGREVLRDNMPAGAIGYQTLASSATADDGKTWLTNALSTSAFVAGTNVFAAEVHQNAVNSSDMTFQLVLDAARLVPTTPTVQVQSSGALTFSWPASGDAFALFSATNLTSPVTWLAVTNVPILQNGQWRVTLPSSTDPRRFYQLRTR